MIRRGLVITCACLGIVPAIFAQQTIGLISHTSESLDSGYVLFAPITDSTTYLIDKCGKLIHSWQDHFWPGLSVHLQPNGDLYATGRDNSNTAITGGGSGGWIQRRSWDNQLLWSYKMSDSLQRQHHDIAVLPNGNVLVIAWEAKTKAEVITAGRDSSTVDSMGLLSNKIVELQPVGTDSANIVWEWHAWDHLVQDYDSTKINYGNVATHPELININYYLASGDLVHRDWLHVNSIQYLAQFDQLLISVHNFSEIWIIDHSTTTAEAASHSGGHYGKGGDLLYRWGNPQAYGHGDTTNQVFFGQHDATWIPAGYPHAGDIMVFNNGVNRHGISKPSYSSVDIFKPAVDSAGNYSTSTIPYLPDTIVWDYTDSVPTDFFSLNMGGAQMLSDGNVLICNAQKGTFFEVDSLGNTVWKYINPVDVSGPEPQGSSPTSNQVFRCTFYPYAYPAFAGKTLAEGPPIETNPNNYSCNLNINGTTTGISTISRIDKMSLYPDPADNVIHVTGLHSATTVSIYNSLGELVKRVISYGNINVSGLNNGIYYIMATNKQQRFRHKFLIMR